MDHSASPILRVRQNSFGAGMERQRYAKRKLKTHANLKNLVTNIRLLFLIANVDLTNVSNKYSL